MAYRRHTVEVDVDLEDFDDDELVAEVRLRKIEHKVYGASKKEAPDPEEAAKDLYSWIAVHRYDKAREASKALLAAFLPPEIIAAVEAIEAGRWMDATCELDDYLWPSPARDAAQLPFKEKAVTAP